MCSKDLIHKSQKPRHTGSQLLSIGCDSGLLNDIIVEELQKLVDGFPGEVVWVRCFTHVINLVTKSVIRQFDMPKDLKKDIVDEALAKLKVLATDLEHEEEETRRGSSTVENNKESDNKNTEGWIDEQKEMSNDEIAELNADVQPVCLILLKVYCPDPVNQTYASCVAC